MPRNYDQVKEDSRAYAAAASRIGRDIAAGYPPSGDLARRAACGDDLERFCKTYFPEAFPLPWSPDHLRVIARMQSAILGGGLFALAMPRGAGKTTLVVRAALWALLYGHRRFVVLVGATEAAAGKLLRQVKSELQYAELLGIDHRQVCYPIQRLENNARKCIGQLFAGEQTAITWSAKELVFPTMPDDACDGPNVSGSTIAVAGLTGAIRGHSHVLASGEILRPDLAILDDPQTRESALSLVQTEDRLAIVRGDVLGMAGPGRKITAIMPCTVIGKDDLADQLLDRKRSAQWQGERTKLIYDLPTNTELWDEYAERRATELRNGGDGSHATEFYRERQAAMDLGANVAWPERFNPDELSAVQHAMNLMLQDRHAFYAEYQNEPLQAQVDEGQLKAEVIAARCNGLARGIVPLAATRLTAYVDVQQRLLYWIVVAWADDFTGAVIDYGAYPDQGRPYFHLSDAQKTLGRAAPGAGLEGSIFAGLSKLADQLLSREWAREDNTALKIERLLVDANWGASTDTVYAWCRQTTWAALVMPSHGRYVGAASKPWSEYQARPGERLGYHWLIPVTPGKRATRHLLIDTNFWKTFLAERMTAAIGDRGALTLFGKPGHDHRMFSEHCAAEYRVRTEGRGRTVDEWRLRPEKPDNHFWDCLVGCAASGSVLGVSLKTVTTKTVESQPKSKPSRKSYEEKRQAFEKRRGF